MALIHVNLNEFDRIPIDQNKSATGIDPIM